MTYFNSFIRFFDYVKVTDAWFILTILYRTLPIGSWIFGIYTWGQESRWNSQSCAYLKYFADSGKCPDNIDMNSSLHCKVYLIYVRFQIVDWAICLCYFVFHKLRIVKKQCIDFIVSRVIMFLLNSSTDTQLTTLLRFSLIASGVEYYSLYLKSYNANGCRCIGL